MKTPEEIMTAIRSKIGDRKALATNSVEHASHINKNRAERAALSLEIKALVPQWAAAKKADAKADAALKVEALKAAKALKKAAKPEAEVHVG